MRHDELVMKNKRRVIFSWVFFALISGSVIAGMVYYISVSPTGQNPRVYELLFPLVPVAFAFVGALIISRHPSNVIGLLMMVPGLALTFVTDAYLQPFINGQILPPTSPSILFLLILWYSNWNWFLLILPVIFIMVLFPTGRPFKPSWIWLIYTGMGIVAIFIFLATFSQDLAPGSGEAVWLVSNPIGFLKLDWINLIVNPLLVVFPIWIVLCAISLFVRFHRAKAVEREQIKWLFYAGVVFILFYTPSFIGNTYSQAENLWNALLPIGLLTFPAAIAIAILRYRLYDIDIIIRRTLQYSILTGTLALVYFGTVVLLQNLFVLLTGEQSPVVIVVSTLVIAALFTPLRVRIQDFIDRRFYRSKYDAERTLSQFAETARDEVDLDKLTDSLISVVTETMEPEKLSLWLKQERR